MLFIYKNNEKNIEYSTEGPEGKEIKTKKELLA